MYKTILVPMALDHDVSSATLKIARMLCVEGGSILALHVHEIPPNSVTAYLDNEILDKSFETARTLLEEKTKDAEGVTTKIVKGHTYRTIIEQAEENGVDCIVMGSHKPGLSDYLLGSTAARVVRHAACAVHVHRTS